MNTAQQLLSAMSSGMDIISGASAAMLRDFQPDPFARELMRLHATYFGKTMYTRKQARAIAAARKTHKSLTAIRFLESKLKGLKEVDRWNIREALLSMDLTADQLAAEAGKRAKAIKDQDKPAKPKGVTIRRSSEGPWEIKITGDSEDITDMKDALGDTIESAKDFFFGDEKASRPIKQTNVIITLDEFVEILEGHGDDLELRMTNGATISGARFIQQKLHEFGLFTLVHPYHGPVNLYRAKRTASEKQRLMAWAENPTCAWPDCHKPAEDCQIHHLHAWKHGGMTNPENLVTLCRYHNGINNDDPTKPTRRGRMERRDGEIKWSPP